MLSLERPESYPGVGRESPSSLGKQPGRGVTDRAPCAYNRKRARMYVVIEKATGKIVWVSAHMTTAPSAGRKFAADNPGKAYYVAYLYFEVVTGKTEEKTSWSVEP